MQMRFNSKAICDSYLVIDGGIIIVRPSRLCHRQPLSESLEPEVQHPLWLMFFGRYASYHILVKSFWESVALNNGPPAR